MTIEERICSAEAALKDVFTRIEAMEEKGIGK